MGHIWASSTPSLVDVVTFEYVVLRKVGKGVKQVHSPLDFVVQDWDQQSATQIVTELCGFVTILSGTFLLHATKDMGDSSSGLSSYTPLTFSLLGY